uniref:NADH-ubiquinone oxidoreductase chain 4L n=1 Tax=Craterolophus convolvulus TaxID=37531 RepID=G9IT50_9CNID|nr:NADH dehydrogenase subunit 4L [Craterolophus convolvulus]
MWELLIWISLIIFTLGTTGILLNRSNLILTIMSIELMFLASALLLLLGVSLTDSLEGQIFTLFILTVAAAESAIGLAILIAHYRLKGNISLNSFTLLRG